MAIAVNSPAWNTADFGTSLGFDQRGQRRPALGGVDIGAFELCLQNMLDVQLPCVIAGFEESARRPESVQLTIAVDPPGDCAPARCGNDQCRSELTRGSDRDAKSRVIGS